MSDLVRASRDFRRAAVKFSDALHEFAAGRKPGWQEMRARSAPGECPLCGEPLAAWDGTGRKPVTCGGEICRRAWHRYWRRDQRALLALERAGKVTTKRRKRTRRARQSTNDTKPGAGTGPAGNDAQEAKP